ncbi:uncharacterized protein LOC111999944 [Quercus suber]|uniref:uncharacterized protein LOC111999944 n=1 Tax=Quercus suber TaxID=58331 RepID=UPI000CE1D4EF|nr:uncharacterized protein LOC111999944 [Quercus suber]
MTVWSVWTQRNQARLNKPHSTLSQIAPSAKARLDEFSAAQPVASPSQRSPRASWQPPPSDLYKINYDAATFQHEGKSGIGVIIRDSHGAAIASLSQLVPCTYQAADMEAIAANRVLEFAREIGINEAILEGDSSLVHLALKRGEHSLSPFGLLVEDIKLSSASFSKLLYSHTKREVNKVAHGLARHAIHVLDYVV